MIAFTDPTTGKRVLVIFQARWPGYNRGLADAVGEAWAAFSEPDPTD